MVNFTYQDITYTVRVKTGLDSMEIIAVANMVMEGSNINRDSVNSLIWSRILKFAECVVLLKANPLPVWWANIETADNKQLYDSYVTWYAWVQNNDDWYTLYSQANDTVNKRNDPN
jgi:hypothetical protein